jgi:hypothetical protein
MALAAVTNVAKKEEGGGEGGAWDVGAGEGKNAMRERERGEEERGAS